MIFRTPSYYKDFRCIADKCKDNCCIGWEIDIDNDTAEKYRSVSGDFGQRLQNNINFGDTSSFILGKNERCPFLNNCNLCDIITELGEDSLCQICSDHPRYYEWFGSVKEGGIGMCCEESARIILTQTCPFTVMETHIPDEDSEPFDTEMYNYLYDLRENFLSILQNEEIPLGERLKKLLEISVAEQGITYSAETGTFADILQFLHTLEPISESWHPTLSAAEKKLAEISARKADFLQENPYISVFLRNIAVYFLWRYLLKGVFDGDFLSRTVLAVVSVIINAVLWASKWLEDGLSPEDCIEIAKNYSKEIEYNEENLEAFLDGAYDLTALSMPALFDILDNFIG